jgi:hypothetical protein
MIEIGPPWVGSEKGSILFLRHIEVPVHVAASPEFNLKFAPDRVISNRSNARRIDPNPAHLSWDDTLPHHRTLTVNKSLLLPWSGSAGTRPAGKLDPAASDNNNQRTVHKNHATYHISPPLSHPISISIVVQLPKIFRDKPKQANEQVETHHNSPQTPKIRFIHSQLVRPQLLTFISPGNAGRKAERKIGLRLKRKSPILERMGLKNMPAIT